MRKRREERFENAFVLSVGNLSAGGTGKTPATALIAEHFASSHPLVVLRGYMGQGSHQGILVSDGNGPLCDAGLAGDEAIQLAHIPGVRVAIGKNRGDVIRRYIKNSRLIILDDAFQNPSVYRDHELVLIDATIPPSKVTLFPTGTFREDLSALTRADTILLTRTNLVSKNELKHWIATIENIAPLSRLFLSVHEAQPITPKPPSRTIGAFCGIGNPDSFFQLLEKRSFRIAWKKTFPDHHLYSQNDIDLLEKSALPLVTTEKDFVRFLAVSIPFAKRLCVLPIRLKILNNQETEFLRIVQLPEIEKRHRRAGSLDSRRASRKKKKN